MSSNSSSGHIVVDSLSLTFRAKDHDVHALSDINLTIKPGEFVSLIGPSGCGKTTLLRVIADLQEPSSGHLTIDGQTPQEARENHRYGFVFQAAALYPWRTIEKNVTLPLELMGMDRKEQRKRAKENLELVGLADFHKKYPWQLSGGMQQRASIARALSFQPGLLLMDEPFGALDEITRDRLNMHLLDLWRQTGKTVVFVTHSIPEAVFLSSRIVVMSPRPGRIIDVIDTNLPADRTLEIREDPAFTAVAQKVRNGLKHGHSDESL